MCWLWQERIYLTPLSWGTVCPEMNPVQEKGRLTVMQRGWNRSRGSDLKWHSSKTGEPWRKQVTICCAILVSNRMRKDSFNEEVEKSSNVINLEKKKHAAGRCVGVLSMLPLGDTVQSALPLESHVILFSLPPFLQILTHSPLHQWGFSQPSY